MTLANPTSPLPKLTLPAVLAGGAAAGLWDLPEALAAAGEGGTLKPE